MRFFFLRSTSGPISGRRYASFGSRSSLGKNRSSTTSASMELTASNVRPYSLIAFAPADTSRLLTCSAAATSAWLAPPLASIIRIFLFLDIGIEPLSVTAPRIGRTVRNTMIDARGTRVVYARYRLS